MEAPLSQFHLLSKAEQFREATRLARRMELYQDNNRLLDGLPRPLVTSDRTQSILAALARAEAGRDSIPADWRGVAGQA